MTIIMRKVDREKESFTLIWFVNATKLLPCMILVCKSSDKSWEKEIIFFALHFLEIVYLCVWKYCHNPYHIFFLVVATFLIFNLDTCMKWENREDKVSKIFWIFWKEKNFIQRLHKICMLKGTVDESYTLFCLICLFFHIFLKRLNQLFLLLFSTYLF